MAQFAREKGFSYTPVYFASTAELVAALQADRRIDAALSSNLRAVDHEWILAEFAPSPFYIMVRKDNKALLDEINRVLNLVFTDHPDLRTTLMNQYYMPESRDEIAYTAEERAYIAAMQNTTFTAFLNPDRTPLSYFSNGRVTGILGEIASKFIARTGLNIDIIELKSRDEYFSLLDSRQSDICLDFAHDFALGEEYGYRLTAPYCEAGISRLYLKNNPNRKVAGLTSNSYIVTEFKESIAHTYEQVLFFDTTKELVAAIESGDCDVGFFYTQVCEQLIANDIKNHLVSELVYGSNVNFCAAVNAEQDPLLFSIVSKAVSSLGENEIKPIVQKFSSFQDSPMSLLGFVYSHPLFLISCISVLFILLILVSIIVLLSRKRELEAIRLAEEKRQNGLLFDALTTATEASEAKSQFLSRMSHEMRTPLNAMIGFMELAKDASLEQRNFYRENTLIASKQLLSVINDVLDMSAIGSGKLKISNAPFSLKQLVHDLTNIYFSQCKDKGIDFQVVLESPVDEQLVGDMLRLNQILMNLLGNAVKFTNEGFVRLSIKQHTTEESSIFLRFAVSDSGCGMSEDMLARIGQPFEQDSAESARKYGGSGLGLSIVKMLVSIMGGAFRVESVKGAGSTLSAELPFAKDATHRELSLPSGAKTLRVLATASLAQDRDYLSTFQLCSLSSKYATAA